MLQSTLVYSISSRHLVKFKFLAIVIHVGLSLSRNVSYSFDVTGLCFSYCSTNTLAQSSLVNCQYFVVAFLFFSLG